MTVGSDAEIYSQILHFSLTARRRPGAPEGLAASITYETLLQTAP